MEWLLRLWVRARALTDRRLLEKTVRVERRLPCVE